MPEIPAYAPPAAVAAEATVSAERAGRLVGLGRKIGDVAMAGVSGAGEILGRAADVTANVVVGGARKVAEAASEGYAFTKTTVGMAQAGVNPFARESKPVVPQPLGTTPPPERHSSGFLESLKRSARFNAVLGGVAAAAVIGGKIAAARHGMEVGGTGGGGHAVIDALPKPDGGSTGLHISADSLPGTGHLNLELAADSSVGSNGAGHAVGNVIKGGGVVGGVVGIGAAVRGRLRRQHAEAARNRDAARIHATRAARNDDARRARQLRNNTRRTYTPLVQNGQRMDLVDGTPQVGGNPFVSYDSGPRTPRIRGPYDPNFTEGRRVMEEGGEYNDEHPLGGH